MSSFTNNIKLVQLENGINGKQMHVISIPDMIVDGRCKQETEDERLTLRITPALRA